MTERQNTDLALHCTTDETAHEKVFELHYEILLQRRAAIINVNVIKKWRQIMGKFWYDGAKTWANRYT